MRPISVFTISGFKTGLPLVMQRLLNSLASTDCLTIATLTLVASPVHFDPKRARKGQGTIRRNQFLTCSR